MATKYYVIRYNILVQRINLQNRNQPVKDVYNTCDKLCLAYEYNSRREQYGFHLEHSSNTNV